MRSVAAERSNPNPKAHPMISVLRGIWTAICWACVLAVISAVWPQGRKPDDWPTPAPTLSSVVGDDDKNCTAYILSMESNAVRCVVWRYPKGKNKK